MLLEEDLAAFAPERFEAALRIDKWQPQDHAHDRVEDDAREFAERRLMNADQAAVERPGAYGDIVVLQRVKKLWSFFDRRGKIGIREEHHAAARFLHAVADAESFAAVHAVGNDAQAWKCLPKGFGDLRGAIFRTIIDDENLCLTTQAG